MLVNSSSIFSGLWTRFGKNTRSSDYVISQEMMQYMKNVKIDDSRCSSLFTTIKEKDNKLRVVHNDHVSIFINLDLKITEPKVRQKNDTWKFNQDGLHKFKSITKNNMLLDSLFTSNSNKSGCTEFYQWEKPVQSLLYQCFTRVHPQKNKNTQPSDVYEKLNEIDNLIKSKHSNTNLQKEKEEILNKICILEKKSITILSCIKESRFKWQTKS